MKFDSQRNSKSLLATWILVVAFFAIFVLFPLFCALISVRASDFKTVFTQQVWRDAMKNTLLECVASTTISVLVGYIFAYAVVKANIPFKRFFSVLPILHLMTPPFVGGLAFILLFGRQGFITKRLLHLNVSLYGFWGLLIAQVLCFFPMAYLICVQTLKGINTNLEKAARTLGASNARIFFTITLPLSLPGIISSFLFIAVSVLSDFGNPLIVAGRFRVLAVEIYTQLTGWLRVGTSVVLGIVLVVPSVILFFLQNKTSEKIGAKVASIGGKNAFDLENANKDSSDLDFASKKNVSLGAKIALTLFVLFISILIFAQILAIIAGSFQELWGIKTDFTTAHIKAAFAYKTELRNSVVFALISAILSTLIASVSSFLVHRTNVPLRKTIDVFAQLPSAIPGTLLGLSISIAANTLHFRGSAFLIVVAMTVAFLPFSYRAVSNSYIQISETLDNGARSLGANQMTVFATIIAPIAKGGIFSGFVYDFIRGVGTLSAVIFLVSFTTPLTSIRIINLAEQGDWGKSAALALILTTITFAILGLAVVLPRWLKRKSRWLRHSKPRYFSAFGHCSATLRAQAGECLND